MPTEPTAEVRAFIDRSPYWVLLLLFVLSPVAQWRGWGVLETARRLRLLPAGPQGDQDDERRHQ